MRPRMLAAALALALSGTLGAQAPIFRSSVDLVSIDVSVRSGTRPLAGLTKQDFELTDNGEPQMVAALNPEVLPIDLTLVLDASGSVQGPLLASLTRAIDAIQQRLRPDDRIGVIKFNERITLAKPLSTGAAGAAALLGATSGSTSLLDAISAALIQPHDAERRQLAVIFTDGNDTESFLDESRVAALADRLDCAVFVVAATQGNRVFSENTPHRKLFDTLTSRTGGEIAVLQRNASLGDSFVQMIDTFRASYVMRYVFQGQAKAGWHEVAVRVKRPGRYDVRWRRGYFAAGSP